jgi:peptidoglycan/LPS O-acetylase OafA/YrhL
VLVLTVPENGAHTTIMDRGGYTGVALLAAALILALDQGRPAWLFRAFGCGPLAWLGRISYGFYLWHFPVTGFAGDKLVARLGRGPATVVAGLLAIGLAAASYYLLERPVQRRRPKWASGRSAPAPSSGAAVPAARSAPVAVPAGETTLRLSGAVSLGREATLRLRFPRRGSGGQER